MSGGARGLGKAGRGIGLAAVAVLMLGPVYLLVVNSFKPAGEIARSPFALPLDSFTFDYLASAATNPRSSMLKAYAVTVGLVIVVNVLSVLVTGPAAFAIARGRSRWHRLTFLFLLAGLFIPSQVILIPVIYVLRTVHLMGTLPGLFLFQTAATVPTTVFLFAAYIQSVPRELDEAAVVDGASRQRIFWQVVFPIMRPAVATAVVINSVVVWCDFVGPRIILGPGSGVRTVTTGVYGAITKYSTDFTVVYPSMLLAAVPVLIFYVLLQKRIIGGVAAGAVKG
jgi:raffinose/stachyose/melibiose transport system permease protein